MGGAEVDMPVRGGRRRRRRRWPASLTAVLVPVLVATGVVLVLEVASAGDDAVAPQSGNAGARPITAAPSPSPSTSWSGSQASAAPSRSATAQTSGTAGLLQLPGPVPSEGTGRFAYADAGAEQFGTAGPLRRYRVAVERGAQEHVEDFAAAVDRALGDEQSWTAGGALRLRRVGGDDRHDFTVHLATPATAGRMCARGGIDISVSGRPYTSCRLPGQVVINLDRWRLSVSDYIAWGTPLDTYRTYVVNHEVGHELGYGHEACPGKGRAAPVMMQQTLFLDGCVPSPWSHLDGKRYAGPAL
ncbi:DUF3152 domain-containing protein [Melissospora conviva]|uniref:DUF3152 domain-containing protein n=1 Tax=Melissospora conviva TaxID=3388432 RepID=UPI003C183FCF